MLYGSNNLTTGVEQIANSNEMLEAMIVDDLMRGTDEQRKSFCESEFAKVLVEKAVLKKPTMMRLGKDADEKRRIKLAAYELAKNANDPLWKKLEKAQAQRKMFIEKIMQKYGKKAEKIAKESQKNYIKAMQHAGSTTTEEKK